MDSLSRQPEGWTNCCGTSKIFSWFLHLSRTALGTALPTLAPRSPPQPPPLPGRFWGGGRGRIVRGSWWRKQTVQVVVWCGQDREILGKESTSTSESLLHPSFLLEGAVHFWVVPLRHHGTLQTRKFCGVTKIIGIATRLHTPIADGSRSPLRNGKFPVGAGLRRPGRGAQGTQGVPWVLLAVPRPCRAPGLSQGSVAQGAALPWATPGALGVPVGAVGRGAKPGVPHSVQHPNLSPRGASRQTEHPPEHQAALGCPALPAPPLPSLPGWIFASHSRIWDAKHPAVAQG